MQSKFTKIEIESARNRSIHAMLGMRNNGRRVSICCPMPGHHDSSPSFALYPDNSFHCFGCTAHGANAVDFTMQLLNIEFAEAVKELQNYNTN